MDASSPESPGQPAVRHSTGSGRPDEVDTYIADAERAIAAEDFEAAITACEEVLGRQADNEAALALLDRIRLTLNAREAGARDHQADACITAAFERYAAGDGPGAISLLERFEPAHPDVTVALTDLRTGMVAVPRRRRTASTVPSMPEPDEALALFSSETEMRVLSTAHVATAPGPAPVASHAAPLVAPERAVPPVTTAVPRSQSAPAAGRGRGSTPLRWTLATAAILGVALGLVAARGTIGGSDVSKAAPSTAPSTAEAAPSSDPVQTAAPVAPGLPTPSTAQASTPVSVTTAPVVPSENRSALPEASGSRPSSPTPATGSGSRGDRSSEALATVNADRDAARRDRFAPAGAAEPPASSTRFAPSAPSTATAREDVPRSASPSAPPPPSDPVPDVSPAVAAPSPTAPSTSVALTPIPAAPGAVPTAAPPPSAASEVAAVAPPPAATASVPTRRDDDERAVRSALRAYADAYSGLDVDGVKRVYPGVNEPALRRAFRALRSQRVELQGASLVVSGDTATVTGTLVSSAVGQVGSSTPVRDARPVVFDLVRRDGAWIIVERR